MGKLAGLILIASGVGTAAYVYPMMNSAERFDRQLADVVSITTGAVPAGQPQLTRSPTIVVKPAAQDTKSAVTKPVVTAQMVPGKLPPPGERPSAPMVSAPVTDAPGARPIDVPLPAGAKRFTKGEDEARITLTRDIQRELKRVGCYEGSADGTWTPETREAMKQFIDRVNATLPVEGPDHVLKTLVQGHPGGACGRSCPTGQALSGDSRCVPTAIIAAPKRVPSTRDAAVVAPAPQPATKASSWEPKVVPAPEVIRKSEPRPQVAAIPESRPDSRPADVKIDRTEPLPGRTSLGATGVPPTAPASAPVTEAPAPRAKRPVIVVKPREERPSPDSGAAALPGSPATKSAPSIGAVAAIESPDKSRPRPVTAPPSPPQASRPPSPPPQRYVSSAPPPIYRERPRFGPQIFRDMERSGR